MGKNAVWQKISDLLSEDTIPREDGFIDITDGAIIPWWLWTCNLGNRTRYIIGEGITTVLVNRASEQEVVFIFIRVDNTNSFLRLGCRVRGGSSEVYTKDR